MKFVRKKKDGSITEINKAEKKSQIKLPPWKVLIVDDENDIHTMTQLALKNFQFAQRPLQIFQAMSGTQAREILQVEPDIAVALIDVVMETDDAGLQLIDFIRNQLKYFLIRLIIRTGQPGMAPEREVIERYDIDDYKNKTELSVDKLYTTMRVALKSYRDLTTLESNRKALRKILEAMPEFHHAQSLNQFLMAC
jgi:CheY-like chemotaxis protein